ncbi:arylamine N-acetyltransferase 1 [Cucurbitaria berberidis CBS 394.84]|uniref:Arylamine N-acetyltransferase 1 n=1 Tax=Cucurbitaria berberidis CBS 394.84 TaxID=1168544 RepID=A0A9P4GG05_9PLEO|nr:arylamine N-acetyltransferase 1 [Cucurbitaria berberidis CBS 394.84]KAF1845388.1 arylamine N-acetyltransferase 1 [Cucurbitaria berberidis CBS 394.84]
MAAEQHRSAYSKEQMARYLDRLKLPHGERHFDVAAFNPNDALAYLALLQKHHLAEIPFENLTLHYSVHRQVSLHPEELFKKIIGDNNGRGGYCMENNGLFGTLLHSLGFNVYSAGARVFDHGQWTGWSHMVNFVKIGGTKYHVDVGFGAEGPVVPMPLDRSGAIQQHISPATTRLQYRNIPGTTDPDQRFWVYEYRRNGASDWEIKYSYTELEFFPQDYAVMNYFTSTTQRTFFTRIVVVEKKILGRDGDMAGNLILMGNSLKRRIHWEKEKEVEFHSEAERLDALQKYFNISFGAAERDGIRGLPSEIK